MAYTITHAKVTSGTLNNDVEVDLGDWNDNHTITGSVAASEITSGAALTRVDDTNVTLTLGGTPTTALLAATSITAGWSGTLAASRGGFGADVSASSGVPLFATGAATFTGTSGSGNFVRVTSASLTTPDIGAATGTSTALTGASTIYNATAIPAGGAAGTGYKFSSTSNYGIFFGSGVPTLSAAQGSIYLRSDGTPYYNTNGTTGWTAIGGGGTPGGSTTQVQYNNASAFGGISGATSDGTSLLVTTQSARDNSTKSASTAYVDTATREKLTASRTYYVRTDGSNSNTGLANTSGGAFLTINKAIDTIATLDIGGQSVTIQVGDGTYTTAVVLKNTVGFASAGSLVIQGNNGTPANVVISTTSADAITADGLSVIWDIKDLKVQTTTSGSSIVVKNGSTVRYGNLNYGACASYQNQVFNGGKLVQLSSYTISGAATYHWGAYDGGIILGLPSSTITITGTPAFGSSFILCGTLGLFDGFSITFSGSATGVRYNVYGNSVIFTNGGGATYFPGGTAGTTATGGQYI